MRGTLNVSGLVGDLVGYAAALGLRRKPFNTMEEIIRLVPVVVNLPQNSYYSTISMVGGMKTGERLHNVQVAGNGMFG